MSLMAMPAFLPGGPGAQNGKGAQSDPNYVSRLGLGPVANVCRGPKNYSYATEEGKLALL